MKKNAIGVGVIIALIITAISANYVYANMYGRTVAKSLQRSSTEHVGEAHAAMAKEKALTDQRIMESLTPNFDEKVSEVAISKEYGAKAAEEARLHNLEQQVASMVSGGDKGTYQKYAWSQFDKYGWGEGDFSALINLWNRESGWNPNAHNRSSGAHGIPQALPASMMASYGSDYMTGYKTQIDWGLNYIAGRYGSPSNAWGHFCSRGWY